MVWPSLTYYSTFDGVIFSYTEAANMNNDILCPVGEVWKSHFDVTNDFSYYGTDGFHPSLEGSNVAAQIIYESLFPN
jgi:lysophospholipase L1-like esterase